ncbi:MAG: DUF2971 domain-containing protein [Bacteroidaceae bacterium]|nr:DUF2971 domain-containing protein [Bacteroidaceae bacterium]
MEIKLLNISPNDLPKHIFKYMSLSYAIDTIRKDTLWFSDPEEWNDPYESYFMNNAYVNANNPFDFPLKEKVYASCFTMVSNSEAQWKAYCDQGISIRFDILRDEFLLALDRLSHKYDVYIGKVIYLPTHKLNNLNVPAVLNAMGNPPVTNDIEKALYLMLCKRVAFSYEQEIRVFLIPKNMTTSAKKGVEENVGLKAITDRYTISPLNRDVQEVIKAGLTSVHNIKNVYCATLYEAPANQVLDW